MDESYSLIGKLGERTLAAVMFTDVVGFSSRMNVNESETLELLDRDFSIIGDLVKRYRGKIIKTIGDGLLISFTGAVNAVACGIEIQKAFNHRPEESTKKKFLTHRIGIHLGDIYVSESEIMGDGVNVASRLQSESEPGGICISKTVLDVIKGKIELQAVSLGPKKLKNISESIQIYQIVTTAIVGQEEEKRRLDITASEDISKENDRQKFSSLLLSPGNFYFFPRIICFLEIILIILLIFSYRSQLLNNFLFFPSSISGYHFLEGIFKYPSVRISFFLSFFPVSFLALEVAFRKLNFKIQNRILFTLVFMFLANALFLAFVFIAIVVLHRLDPLITAW